ncbi:MAG: hypothetical protein AVDCRST_MAG89-317, partial [uncultured Gemmatimonadetes bacterium]
GSQSEPQLRLLPHHRRGRDGERHPRGRRDHRVPRHPAAAPGARSRGAQGALQEPVLRSRRAGDAHLRGGQAHSSRAAQGDGLPGGEHLFAQRRRRRTGRVPLSRAPDPGAQGRAVPASAAGSQRRGAHALAAGRDGDAHHALRSRRGRRCVRRRSGGAARSRARHGL